MLVLVIWLSGYLMIWLFDDLMLDIALSTSHFTALSLSTSYFIGYLVIWLFDDMVI